jgi:glycosyltransferase involved in cell wall biosynthesis
MSATGSTYRITFLLPHVGVAGGVRAVLEIADRLVGMGHTVRILYPEIVMSSRRNRLLRHFPGARPFLLRNPEGLSWHRTEAEVQRVSDLEADHVPDADALIATSWHTAERAASFPPSKGERFYFIQHYEVWDGPRSRVDRTWRQGFHRIASSEWLARLGRERFGIEEMDVVPYGVDMETFRPDPEGETRRGGERLRVGLLYHPEPWKGVGDGLEAIRRVGSRGIEVRPVLFGTCPRGADVPEGAEYHHDPPQQQLRVIYSSMDLYLCPSHEETGPLMVPEAMACGTPVVSTDVGNVSLWTEGGKRALLVPPRDVDALSAALERALCDSGLREELAREGREYIQHFTWDRTAGLFERALRRRLEPPA